MLCFNQIPTLLPMQPEADERAKYSRFQAYYDSKLAQVMHSSELARHLEGSNVKVVSLHPGTCLTNLVRLPAIKVSAFNAFNWDQTCCVSQQTKISKPTWRLPYWEGPHCGGYHLA